MQKNTGKPTYQSDARNGKHKDIVWQVWNLLKTNDDDDEGDNPENKVDDDGLVDVGEDDNEDVDEDVYDDVDDDIDDDVNEYALQVKWATDNLDGYLNFYSVSGDGRFNTM